MGMVGFSFLKLIAKFKPIDINSSLFPLYTIYWINLLLSSLKKLYVTKYQWNIFSLRKIESLYIFFGSFIEPYQSREMRFIETKPVHVGPTYIVQFELVMACRNMYSMNRDNLLYLEYSTNHGLSWRLVEEPCFPPTTCQSYTEGTVYQPSKFQKWSQITVPMPPSSW